MSERLPTLSLDRLPAVARLAARKHVRGERVRHCDSPSFARAHWLALATAAALLVAAAATVRALMHGDAPPDAPRVLLLGGAALHAAYLLYLFRAFERSFLLLTDSSILCTALAAGGEPGALRSRAAPRRLECLAFDSIISVDVEPSCVRLDSLRISTATDERFVVPQLAHPRRAQRLIQRAAIVAIPLSSPARR